MKPIIFKPGQQNKENFKKNKTESAELPQLQAPAIMVNELLIGQNSDKRNLNESEEVGLTVSYKNHQLSDQILEEGSQSTVYKQKNSARSNVSSHLVKYGDDGALYNNLE